MATTLENANPHPRDARIVFDEGPHIYYLDGKALAISVTGFIHKFFHDFDADAVIPRLITNPKKTRYYGRTVEDVKKEWKDIADKASSLGTKMHLAIELFYNGELEDHPEEARHFHGSKEESLFMTFHDELIKGSPLVAYRTEWSVYTDRYKLAGQIDMAYYNKETDSLELYDWKRSKKIEKTNQWRNGKGPVSHLPDSNFWHYSLQLNVYKFILESEYGMKVTGMYLVFLHPNQDHYIREEISDFQYEVRNMFEDHMGRWKPVMETAGMAEVDDTPFAGIRKRGSRPKASKPKKTCEPATVDTNSSTKSKASKSDALVIKPRGTRPIKSGGKTKTNNPKAEAKELEVKHETKRVFHTKRKAQSNDLIIGKRRRK